MKLCSGLGLVVTVLLSVDVLHSPVDARRGCLSLNSRSCGGQVRRGKCADLNFQRNQCLRSCLTPTSHPMWIFRSTSKRHRRLNISISLFPVRYGDRVIVRDGRDRNSRRLAKCMKESDESCPTFVISSSPIVRIEVKPQRRYLPCVPTGKFIDGPYRLTISIRPVRECPNIVINLGCNESLILSNHLSGAVIKIPQCSCPRHRLVGSPVAMCNKHGEWNFNETTKPRCEATVACPHPQRLLVVMDTDGDKEEGEIMKSITTQLFSMLDLRRNGDDHVSILYPGENEPISVGFQQRLQFLTLEQLIQTIQTYRLRRRLIKMLEKAMVFFPVLPKNESEVSSRGFSVLRSMVIITSRKTRKKFLAATSQAARLAQTLKLERNVDIFSIELFLENKFDYRPMVSYLVSNKPRETDGYVFPLWNPRKSVQKAKVLEELWQTLCPGCVTLKCGQLLRGNCGNLTVRRERCLNETCPDGAYHFEHVRGWPVTVQLSPNGLPYADDVLTIREGLHIGAGAMRLKCTGDDCHNLRPVNLFSHRVSVEISPEFASEPCLKHDLNFQRFMDIEITAPTCPNDVFNVGAGNVTMPLSNHVGEKVVVQCDDQHLVRAGSSVATCTHSGKWNWGLKTSNAICEKIGPNETTCPPPKLPRHAELLRLTGSSRFPTSTEPRTKVQCKRGYQKVTEHEWGDEVCSVDCDEPVILHCQKDGTWKWPLPFRCRPIQPQALAFTIRRRIEFYSESSRETNISCINNIRAGKQDNKQNSDDTATTPEQAIESTAGHNSVKSPPSTANLNFTSPEFRWCNKSSRVITSIPTCMELAFMIDESKSMTEARFNLSLNFTRRVLSFFPSHFNGNAGVRVAIMTFSGGAPRIHTTLENGTTENTVMKVLSDVKPRLGSTNLRTALEDFNSKISPTVRKRCRERVLFITTDGNITAGGSSIGRLSDLAGQLKESRWKIYIIGVVAKEKLSRKHHDLSLLGALASKPTPEFFFKMDDSELVEVTDSIMQLKLDYTQCGVANSIIQDFEETGADLGSFVQEARYPWMVALFRKKEGQSHPSFFCGGALISTSESQLPGSDDCGKTYILTAAHCIKDIELLSRTSVSPNTIVARFGETRFDLIEGTERDFPIEEFFFPPQYDVATRLDFDVAVMEVKGNVKPEMSIRTLCLPDDEKPGDFNISQPVSVAGWGSVKDRSGNLVASQRLREKRLFIQNRTLCKEAMEEGQRRRITNNMLCAANFKTNEDTCPGDSGSPLIQKDPFIENRYLAIGVTSWGASEDEGYCGVGEKHGVYAKLSGDVLRWVKCIVSTCGGRC